MNNILAFFVVAFCAIQTISCDDPIVTIKQGALRGIERESIIGGKYYAFEKIPYIKAPLGELRFKAPEQPEPWEGIRNATELGPMCPQYNPLSKIYNAGSEDCIFCNVYTRDLKAKLPVLVFISGYAYYFDGDHVGLYDPDFMVDDVIVVTFTYRLGVFGFLNLDTKHVSGNAGLKDQNALLRWVRDNIEQFGGDPDKVTLVGISAGSASIYHHMMSRLSTGLFQNVIMISGVSTCDAIYPHKVREHSYALGEQFGFDTENPDEYLTALQSLPYELLVNQSYAMITNDMTNQLFKKMAAFVPVVEKDLGQERFITLDLVSSLGPPPTLVNKVPVMIGYSDKEALIVVNQYAEYLIELYAKYHELFVPNKILYNKEQYDIDSLSSQIIDHYYGDKNVTVENIKEIVECTSLSSMSYEVLRFAKMFSQFVKTWLFKFRCCSSRNVYGNEGKKYGIDGASHGDMTAYLFPLKPLNLRLDLNSREYAMIDQVVTAVTNFCKYGNPTPYENPTWPIFTPENMSYLEFADTMTVKQKPEEVEYQFWQSIYNSKKKSME